MYADRNSGRSSRSTGCRPPRPRTIWIGSGMHSKRSSAKRSLTRQRRHAMMPLDMPSRRFSRLNQALISLLVRQSTSSIVSLAMMVKDSRNLLTSSCFSPSSPPYRVLMFSGISSPSGKHIGLSCPLLYCSGPSGAGLSFSCLRTTALRYLHCFLLRRLYHHHCLHHWYSLRLGIRQRCGHHEGFLRGRPRHETPAGLAPAADRSMNEAAFCLVQRVEYFHYGLDVYLQRIK